MHQSGHLPLPLEQQPATGKNMTMWKTLDKGGKGIPKIPLMVAVQGLSYIISKIQKKHSKASIFNTFYFSTMSRPLGLCTLDHRNPYSWDSPKHYKDLKKVITSLQHQTLTQASTGHSNTLRKHITDRDTAPSLPPIDHCLTTAPAI